MGASFAYYATFSIFPALLLAITVCGFVLGDDAPARERLLDAIATPASREMLEKIIGATFPASFSDNDALLVGTGRRAPTDAETAELGELAASLPLVLG